MYRPTPLIWTSNNLISILSRPQIIFPFLFAQIVILCMFELNIIILITIYMYFGQIHMFVYLTTNSSNLCCLQLQFAKWTCRFSHCFLEAVLQLTLTVIFKKLRFSNYCLKGLFGPQDSGQILRNQCTRTYSLLTTLDWSRDSEEVPLKIRRTFVQTAFGSNLSLARLHETARWLHPCTFVSLIKRLPNMTASSCLYKSVYLFYMKAVVASCRFFVVESFCCKWPIYNDVQTS